MNSVGILFSQEVPEQMCRKKYDRRSQPVQSLNQAEKQTLEA